MALMAQEPQPGPKEKRRRKGAVLGVVLIAIAVVAAIGAASLLTRYMDARVAAARVPTDRVVVARVDIPVASPIQAEWLELVDWPASARPASAASDPATLTGRVALVPISRGEAVLPAKLVTSGARSGLATIVPAGARAVAVRVDDVVGVAGFVHPGDFVDVVAVMKPRETDPWASKVVLQNVKVLAVGKDIEHRPGDDKPSAATVATLMVTPDESERLALAATKGQILLALRGIGDQDEVATSGTAPAALLAMAGPPASSADRRPPRRAAAPAPAQPPGGQVVEILRGDLYEKRDFAKAERKP